MCCFLIILPLSMLLKLSIASEWWKHYIMMYHFATLPSSVMAYGIFTPQKLANTSHQALIYYVDGLDQGLANCNTQAKSGLQSVFV